MSRINLSKENMKKFNLLFAILLPSCSASNCGYSQKGNETVGYVKFVTNETPLLCPNHTQTVIDMKTPGVMTSEKWGFYVKSEADAQTLRDANRQGKQVRITSDTYRWTWCIPDDSLTKVEILSE